MDKLPDIVTVAEDIEYTLQKISALGVIHSDNHPEYTDLVLRAVNLSTDIQLAVGAFVHQVSRGNNDAG